MLLLFRHIAFRLLPGLLVLAACLALPRPAEAAVSGTIRYENLLFPETGEGNLQASEYRPIRQAPVELVGATDSLLLGSTVSDESGHYTIEVNPLLGSRIVYLRVPARQDNERVKVEIVNRWGALYAMVSDLVPLDLSQDHTLDVDGTWADDNGGLFNIFDVILIGSDFNRALAGTTTPKVRIVWYPGASGTFFRPWDRSIQLTSIAGVDTDEYDDDVILHEYGHATAHAYSHDKSPGGPHRLTARHDLRLAWSEGFASFYSALVRGEPQYVDTASLFSAEESIRIMYEMETPGFAEFATGSNNELAIQSALWDLIDGGPGDDDFITRPVEDFWAVFTQHFDSSLECQAADFHTGWEALELPEFHLVSDVFRRFRMAFVPDTGDHRFTTPYNLYAPVPDNGSTELVLNVDEAVTVDDLRLYANLVHSSTPQVALSLLSPEGTEVVLREQNSQWPEQLVNMAWYGPSETWGPTAEPLAAFAGENAQGAWRLKVTDGATYSTGSVRRWELVVTGSRVGADPLDLNEDSVRDVRDLFLFAQTWQDTPAAAKFLSRKADLNRDDRVDAADLHEWVRE